ncbi:MAG: PqqD family protein [Gemmatimonadota bacterium]
MSWRARSITPVRLSRFPPSMDAGRPALVDGPFRRADGVWSSGVQDRAVLYSSPESKAIVLNATGAELWEALESPRRPSELAELLIKRFPHLSADRARADVAAFLDRLVSENVLQPVS